MAEPGGPGTGDSRPGSRSAARLSREAHAAGDATKAAKPRRRVGFRKGTEVDEELWPAETFGGVSDEQFWDDLASDKPLTTTARTAQQDPGGRNRLLDAGPATDLQAAQAPGDDRKRDTVTRDSVTRDDGSRGKGRRGAGSGAYPSPRTAPNPATERTAIQPAYAATQAVPSMTQAVPSMTQAVPSRTSQLPGAAQPVRVASGTSQPMSAASQPMSAASQPMSAASQPISAASQPRAAAAQPGETRARRRPSSTEEDPLTSAAFSLRSSGPVDGRSSLRARDTTRDQYDAEGSGPGSAGSYGGTSPYPYPTPSYGDPSVTQTMNTPPYGENYGYGSGGPAPQAEEPRRQNGTRSHARPEGTGEGTRAGRQAYPREGRQATGSYPAGSYQGNGYQGNTYQGNGYQGNTYQGNGYQGNGYQGNGYQGNGYQGNGHRAPYDPRDDYRRLTHQH